MKRRKPEATAEEKRRKWKEFWGNMLMVAIMMICVPWSAYFYESCSGLTVATRRSLGRISTPASLSSAFNTAFGLTIAALPLLFLSMVKRRQYL